jgi:hypothetical protein
MTTFTVQLEQFADKTKGRADAVVGDVVVQISQAVDRRSPVGDATYWTHPAPKGYVGGRFRGNWQLGVGVIPSGETGAIDPSGAETQGRIIASIPNDAAGRVYYLFNNVPYAQRIEEGWSRQAPTGVVGLTVIEFPRMVDQAAKALAA